MSNKRIRKKQDWLHRPLQKIVITEEWAQSHLPRILQRIRRHREAYVVVRKDGGPGAIVPSEWMRQVERKLKSHP